MIFVDTSAWFAYFFPPDPNHQRVRQVVTSTPQRLVKSDYCVDEILTLFVARGEIRRALDAGHAFFHANIARLHFITPAQIHRAWILFQQRASAGWSFTDCTSKTVVDELPSSHPSLVQSQDR